MRTEEFYSIVKSLKPSNLLSGQIEGKLKCMASDLNSIWCVMDENHLGVEFSFRRSRNITVFEASLMYSTFVKHKKMADIGNFFKCKAGEESL